MKTITELAKSHALNCTSPEFTLGTNREYIKREILKGNLKATKQYINGWSIYYLSDEDIEEYNKNHKRY